MANRGRPRKPEQPPPPDEAARREWWLQQLARIQGAVEEADPEDAAFGRLLVNAGICESKIKDLKTKVAVTEKPATPTRPKFTLDKKGPPKKQ